MPRLFLAILFQFFFSVLCAQSSKIDSLNLVVNTAKEDSTILKAYQEIVTIYSTSDLELAQTYLDSFFRKASISRQHRYLLTAYAQKGILAFRRGNFEKAVELWKEGIKKDYIKDYPTQKGNLLSNIGVGYKVLKNTDSVIKYLKQSIQLNESLHNSEALIANYFSMSDFYFIKQKDSLAIKYLDKLEEIALRTNDQIAIARMHILLGNRAKSNYDHFHAVKELQKAIEIYRNEEPSNQVMIRSLTYEVAKSKMNERNYREALEILLRVKKEFEELNSKEQYFLAELNAMILICKAKTNNLSKTDIALYNTLVKDVDNVPTLSSKTNINFGLAIYDYTTNTTTSKTISRLKKLESPLRKEGNHYSLYYYYDILHKTHKSLGHSKDAFEALYNSFAYLDTLSNIQTKAISMAQLREFNALKKERDLFKLRSKNAVQSKKLLETSKQRWQLIASLFLLGIIALTLGVMYYIKLTKNTQLKRSYHREVAKVKNLEVSLRQLKNKEDLRFTNPKFLSHLKNLLTLSEEQLQTYLLVVKGYTNKEIASELLVSKDAIKKRLFNVYDNLKTHFNLPTKNTMTRAQSVELFQRLFLEFATKQ